MEALSWALHKFVFHGIFWKIHRTHHELGKEGAIFELNDLFSAIFAFSSLLLIFLGIETFNVLFWIGIGISMYGFFYFVVHDGLTHRRFHLGKSPQQGYLAAIIRAHRAHHRTRGREGAESFGLLLFDKKFFSLQKSLQKSSQKGL